MEAGQHLLVDLEVIGHSLITISLLEGVPSPTIMLDKTDLVEADLTLEEGRKAVPDAGKHLEVVMLAMRKAALRIPTIWILARHTTIMKAKKRW